MTNIIASLIVTLITNVVSTDNSVWGPDYSVNLTSYPAQYGQRIVSQATERYKTTNITQRTTITVALEDGDHSFTVDKAISSVTAVLRKLEDWKPAGVRTNEVARQEVQQTGRFTWGYQNNGYVQPLNAPAVWTNFTNIIIDISR